MPWAQFSEFTYGYAVIRETESFVTGNGHPLIGAPVQPSLLKEGTVGYDASLAIAVDFAVLLQFKVPFFNSTQHRTRPCGPGHCTWAAWGETHFRFNIDVSGRQFAAMRGYEEEIRLGYRRGLACYVTPAYWEQAEHDAAYRANAVLDGSAAPLPSTFDGLTGKHSLSYRSANGPNIVMSEPQDSNHLSLRRQIQVSMDVTEPKSPTSLHTLAVESSVVQVADLDRSHYDVETASGALSLLQDSAAMLGSAFVILGHK